MTLDALTLLIVGCFVAAFASILLASAWAQMRSMTALLWWAVAAVVNTAGAGIVSLGLASVDTRTVSVGAGLVLTSMTLTWAGFRVFFGRHPSQWVIGGALALWAAAALLPLPNPPRAMIFWAFLLSAGVLLLACRELLRPGEDRPAATWPLVIVLALHAAFLIAGVIDIGVRNAPVEAQPALTSWFGLIHFERLVFLFGSAVFMVIMARERLELRRMSAWRIDTLTGVANRGAFFASASRMLQRAEREGAALSIIAFDLDHFKEINDSHGHAAGDRVLRAFAATASGALRPGDILGRIGGEEFAALLPGAGGEAAYVIADRIRHAFVIAPAEPGSIQVHATVSAGVATAEPGETLETLMVVADRALYRAKTAGRNRVERAIAPSARGSNVIRVA